MNAPALKSFFIFLLLLPFLCLSKVTLGVDVFFQEGHSRLLKNKNIGIVTNHSGVDGALRPTAERFIYGAKEYSIKAFFSLEHGIDGCAYAEKMLSDGTYGGIPVYSLHGKTKRPTREMLKGIDLLVYDVQDIGSRSYTYATSLFYVMEEAKRNDIEIVVLDRPNPMGGRIVDGPLLDEHFRSFLGYINIAYCHGMTIGELARYFNAEYGIGCKLKVIAMRGWKRGMSFKDTGLFWVPTSPNIPEDDTPLFYPATGIIGMLKIFNIGVGHTLPFKIFGAPWLDGKFFSEKLNAQKLPGVRFMPFNFCPFYGIYKGENCGGVKILITDREKYRPVEVGYLILGLFKSIYPKIFVEKFTLSNREKEPFHKVNGTDEIYNILMREPYPAWKLIEFQQGQRESFLRKREKYLIKEYSVDKP